jgi:hypothetical protein
MQHSKLMEQESPFCMLARVRKPDQSTRTNDADFMAAARITTDIAIFNDLHD